MHGVQTDGSNIVVDLLDVPMPISGRTAYTKLSYLGDQRCGFAELYAAQEWGQLQYSVSTRVLCWATARDSCTARSLTWGLPVVGTDVPLHLCMPICAFCHGRVVS